MGWELKNTKKKVHFQAKKTDSWKKSFGGYFKKVQNLDLRDCICEILSDELEISPYRVRITRVQLYEILEKGGTGSNPSSFIEDSESDQMQESKLKKVVKKIWSPREKKAQEKDEKVRKLEENIEVSHHHNLPDSSSDEVPKN